ncbi:hypothetical protein G7046_g7590 [Stylonectria norvegica]|nr:hypothetical protein G7046_g7590 [Stylonectria norvegica]
MNLFDESVSSPSFNTTTSLIHPVMHLVSTAFLLGSVALQSVLGRPSSRSRGLLMKRAVDNFIDTETPIALGQLLCNIGPDGCHTPGVNAGLVIASPDTHDPDYFYTWTRDSALVFKCIVDRFTHEYDADLQNHIQQYIVSQAKLQGVSNPSGSLSDGSGLGEPKFEVNSSPFTGNWGRPQRDGPALRAIAMIAYAKWLINNGYSSTASDIVWPVLRNDLNYVAQYWNNTGFDLWEEINGSSFFTVASQHRALIEGSAIATSLGKPGASYAAIAPQVLCFLQSFWSPSGGYIDANINANDGRTGKDANTILASIHNFDPALVCDAATFQPCSDKALANHKQVIDSFRFYNINKGIPAGTAVAVGRYSEDVYYNGNPWYLNTLAAAEQLYDALYVWRQKESITVSSISQQFFKDFVPSISAGTFASGSDTYSALIDAVTIYADGYVNIVAQYAASNGSLAEQFSKDNGTPLSAHDLTWSYAAFLTSVDRRAGIVPPSWSDGSANQVPDSCQGTSLVGSYSSATATSFPPSQTPISGPLPPTTSTTKTTATTTSCAVATSVTVTFEELVQTNFGETIKIVGNIDGLGNWDTSKAVPLSASAYTSQNPLWQVTVPLKAGQVIEYKYINVKSGGSVAWERDPNHTYTVPKTCATTAVKSDKWQS